MLRPDKRFLTGVADVRILRPIEDT